MKKPNKDLAKFLSTYEKSAKMYLRDRQATQTFMGALKVDLSRVVVEKKDGRRALKDLRVLKDGHLLKVS